MTIVRAEPLLRAHYHSQNGQLPGLGWSIRYLTACRQLAARPGDALFIGDGIDEVAGARAAGLAAHRALWFVSRWPQTTVTRDEQGLWSATKLVEAVLAAETAAP